MPIEISKGVTTITGQEGMKFFRMVQLKHALKLEMVGLKSRGGSAYATIKREYNLKGNREKVLESFTKLCDEQSAKVPRVIKEEKEE